MWRVGDSSDLNAASGERELGEPGQTSSVCPLRPVDVVVAEGVARSRADRGGGPVAPASPGGSRRSGRRGSPARRVHARARAGRTAPTRSSPAGRWKRNENRFFRHDVGRFLVTIVSAGELACIRWPAPEGHRLAYEVHCRLASGDRGRRAGRVFEADPELQRVTRRATKRAPAIPGRRDRVAAGWVG